jgi:two-component system sensor histidine kinase QseC
MLILARLDPDDAVTQLNDIELSQLILNIIHEMENDARNRNVTIEFQLPDHEIMIKGHEMAMATLLRNLLLNAISYSPEQGAVLIELLESKERAQIKVIDAGPGIPENKREEVFRRFHRGENAQHQPGSGLGLSIVQRIAELHKASVEITDGPTGHGTCIIVSFNKQ